jgi:hypothetical protein
MSDKKTDAVMQTEAEKIWDEIKDRDISLFALNGQKVSDYCTVTRVEPAKCYVVAKVSAVLPALEESLGKKYSCELVDKYIVVSRATKLL